MIDLLIYSSFSREQHDERARNMLDHFRAAGMTLSAKKCQFSQQSAKFAGHRIGEDGVRQDPDHIKDIMKLPNPTNITELQSFLDL